MTTPRVTLPPGQQLVAQGKWPLVGERAAAPSAAPWTVSICGEVERPLTYSLAELAALPQVEAIVDIHCVTRWSKLAVAFRGVLLATLLERSRPTAAARFVSFVAQSDRGHSTSLPLAAALEPPTLVALAADGEPLTAEHGGPVRTVAPERYFYKSLKWLRQIELLADDRLGFWEATAGYHNEANPWREQRFIAANLSKQAAAAIVTGRDFSSLDLRGVDARGRDLLGLVATGAILRAANFQGCQLGGATFDGANLSNANFTRANLRGASFVGADVEGADFSAADLRGANFENAALTAATFVGTAGGALLDRATKIDAQAVDDLTPEQVEYVRRGLDPPG